MLRLICAAVGLLVVGLAVPTAKPASAEQKCYMSNNCSGAVKSNRDCHNCKVKTGGKSWRDKWGTCYRIKNCP